MTNQTDSRGLSLLTPGIDFGLLLMVLTFGTACLSWLTMRPTMEADDPAIAALSTESILERVDAESAELEVLQDRASHHEAEADALDRELQEALRNHRDLEEIEKLRAEVQQEIGSTAQQHKLRLGLLRELAEQQRELERARSELLAELAELEEQAQQYAQQQAAAMQQDNAFAEQLQQAAKKIHLAEEDKKRAEQLLSELATIDGKVRYAQQRANQLETEIREKQAQLVKAQHERKTILINTTPRFQADTNREPVFVFIRSATISPLKEPYCTKTALPGTEIWVCNDVGLSAAKALATGSDFMQLIGGLNTRQQYLFFLVDGKSFETFRAIRAMLRSRGIAFGWEPGEQSVLRFVASGDARRPGTL